MLARYFDWLHLRWPAGVVERLPVVGADGATSLAGVRVTGDLTGVPLLKHAAQTGARAVKAILAESDFARARAADDAGVLDVAIVGAGVSGISAAVECKKNALRFEVFEATREFQTLHDFPVQKPIFTYPTHIEPDATLRVSAGVKEALVAELEEQRRRHGIEVTPSRVVAIRRRADLFELDHAENSEATRARRVLVAIGRTGNYRKLGVPGETPDRVTHRLFDPRDHAGRRVLVVGGGDSALEAAIALATAGAGVTLSYRGAEFVRPKRQNVERLRGLESRGEAAPGAIEVLLGSRLADIRPGSAVLIEATERRREIDNDLVVAMVGREPPLDFFRRSGIAIRGEWNTRTWGALALFLAFCAFLYNWKAGGALSVLFRERAWFPFGVPGALASMSAAASDPATLLGTLAISLAEPGFWYSLAYTLIVVAFGVRRVRRRPTPYVRLQTWTLALVQVVPLFLLPYVLLPWAGHHGVFDTGAGRLVGDGLFPVTSWGHGREYWRAFGLVLAWPLFIWNFFTAEPLWWWLVIGLVQTFVVIPLIVWRWGKGAYCGWICSCGALAETLGDAQRHKMPHGPAWNRLNLAGQAILAIAFTLFFARVWSWVFPDRFGGAAVARFYAGLLSGWSVAGVQLNYYWFVDVFLAGVVGVGLYFWASGRVWCRFFCPLAALMHVYARLGRFRIFAEKDKCISCNLCTAVCHQGIDVMAFANKGLPMEDPECVRCSACVHDCPTGVLSFGRVAADGARVLDRLAASPVQLRESRRALRLN